MTNPWSILCVLFLTRTALGFQFQTLGSISGLLADELALNYREVGTLIGLFMLAGIFLSVPAGMALRFSSERKLVSAGLLMLAIGGVIGALASGIGLLGVGRFICGVGFVFSTVYFTKMVTDWFDGRALATALGVLVMSWPIGIALAQVVQPWMAQTYGWRIAFQLSAGYCLLAAVSVALLYREPPRQDKELVGTTAVANRLSQTEWVLTLTASMVWAFFNAGYVVYLSFSENMLRDHGMAPLEAAALASIPSWIMIAATIVAGQIADRTGRRDQILYLGMACAVMSMLALTFKGAGLLAVLLFGLIGAAPAGVIMALTAQAMPAQARAFGMGVFFTAYFVVSMPAPAIAGWLFDQTGDPAAPMVFAALLFAATAAANFTFRLYQQRIGIARYP